jgi:5-methylphenazine-1-carboxylate 1-monooxygenase
MVRAGWLIYREAAGRHGGYQWPQLSMHRADLQAVLLQATQRRLGAERMHFGWRCTGATQRGGESVAQFEDDAGTGLPRQLGSILIPQ